MVIGNSLAPHALLKPRSGSTRANSHDKEGLTTVLPLITITNDLTK